MKPQITEPKYLSKHLSVHPKARICHRILDRYSEIDVFDLCFELRYMAHGGCFLAVECRIDKKWARHGVVLFGQGDNVVILDDWKCEQFEHYRFFNYDFEIDPEPLYASPEEWHSAYDAYLERLQREGHTILGDFRSVEMMHPALLGTKLGSSSAQKPAIASAKSPAPTPLPADDFEIRASEEVVLQPGDVFTEGSVTSILVNKYERDPEARRRCIEHYGGYSCQICLINLSHTYPGIGTGSFVHVHHLHPLGSVGQAHQVDPIRDLLPVCPNCHAMLHRKEPPYTPDELRASLVSAKPPILSKDDIPF